jgi:hypothetical protein
MGIGDLDVTYQPPLLTQTCFQPRAAMHPSTISCFGIAIRPTAHMFFVVELENMHMAFAVLSVRLSQFCGWTVLHWLKRLWMASASAEQASLS